MPAARVAAVPVTVAPDNDTECSGDDEEAPQEEEKAPRDENEICSTDTV